MRPSFSNTGFRAAWKKTRDALLTIVLRSKAAAHTLETLRAVRDAGRSASIDYLDLAQLIFCRRYREPRGVSGSAIRYQNSLSANPIRLI
jgi:hypothetical protein